MAMLRVSSYRKLFEEQWGRNGGSSAQCAGQYRASVRSAAADDCDCDKLDFVTAKALTKDGLSRFTQERNVIAALNDRLARLIEMARCFEEENESLESQIMELEDQLDARQTSSSTAVALPDYSLDAVIERLRKERDDILCDSEELRGELDCLQQEYEKAVEQRTLVQLERQDVAWEVDGVTAECLALKEQVAIYEAQLANMEAQHETAVANMTQPAESTAGGLAGIEFCNPDISPALDIKEYYCQMAESLEYDCDACTSSAVAVGDGKQVGMAGAAGAAGAAGVAVKEMDAGEMKTHIADLEKELAELEGCNEELEDEIEMKTEAYPEEIAELECTLEEMRHQESDFQRQMREQCEDYKVLLNEKMARDIEIAAYRGLVEEEEGRLQCL